MLPCYTCGCAHTACWALGFLGFLPVLRPPSGSSSPCSSGSSSPLGLPTFVMGSPLWGQGSFVLNRNEGLVSLFGSGVMVSFLVRPRTSVFSFSAHPVPLGGFPGGPRCGRELRLYLVLSSVLPCPMLWLHVRLHAPCSGSGVVLGTLPWILTDGVGASIGGCSLRPEAAGAFSPGGPR